MRDPDTGHLGSSRVALVFVKEGFGLNHLFCHTLFPLVLPALRAKCGGFGLQIHPGSFQKYISSLGRHLLGAALLPAKPPLVLVAPATPCKQCHGFPEDNAECQQGPRLAWGCTHQKSPLSSANTCSVFSPQPQPVLIPSLFLPAGESNHQQLCRIFQKGTRISLKQHLEGPMTGLV